MKKFVLVLSSVLFVFIASAAVSAQAKPEDKSGPSPDATKKESSVSGKWDVLISAPGQEYSGTLKIEKAGDAFKGSITTELGESPMTNIKVDGDGFTALITVSAMGQTFEGTVGGKVKDGKIAGELNLNGIGAVPYSGKKN